MPREARRPRDTLLHRVAREHLDEFLRTGSEHGGLPGFIEATFRAYLRCGDPAERFIRLHCAHCGLDHPARRHFGVLAPGHKRRGEVVPRPTHGKRAHRHGEDQPRPEVAHHVPWAELFKRVWGADALSCPRCGATMTALAVIEDKGEVARFLAHFRAAPTGAPRGPPAVAA